MKMPDLPGRGPVDRRLFLTLGVGAFAVAALPRALRGRRRLVTRTVPVMGTIAEIRVVHDDVDYADAAIDAALDELRRVDRTMTRFSRHSEVGLANAQAAARPVAIGAATACVVERALRWADASSGAFDPCLGEAVALWDVDHRHAPPPEREVEPFAGGSLYRHLELGRSGGQAVLYFHSPRIALDLGGIAKGYGVDRAVDALRARGIRDALVNCGGDLYAMGHSERGDAWEIGVQSPTDPNGIVARFELTDRAIATSGDYRQYFNYHGRRYHHLLDPRTAAPRLTSEHSVSVEADCCMDADAGATAVFGMPIDQADAHLRAGAPGSRVIHHI